MTMTEREWVAMHEPPATRVVPRSHVIVSFRVGGARDCMWCQELHGETDVWWALAEASRKLLRFIDEKGLAR
jgi:hypothetical protein